MSNNEYRTPNLEVSDIKNFIIRYTVFAIKNGKC